MSRNWQAWWVWTIGLNALALVSHPNDMTGLLVTINAIWAMGTVVCLWCRRTDGDGHDLPTTHDECLIDESNTL